MYVFPMHVENEMQEKLFNKNHEKLNAIKVNHIVFHH